MNTIIATIPFSFRGEEHQPSLKIDLNDFAKKDIDTSVLFRLVAIENHIDTYSYQYEVLESSRILYSQATGVACQFLDNEEFDFEAFKACIKQTGMTDILENIAKTTLQINSLDRHEAIQKALLQAFIAGQEHEG
jgi:replication initiation and membrane attachment protein DnaB